MLPATNVLPNPSPLDDVHDVTEEDVMICRVVVVVSAVVGLLAVTHHDVIEV